MYYSGSDKNINELNIAMKVVEYPTDFRQWKEDKKKHSNAGFASTIFIEIYHDDVTNQKYARYLYNGEAQTVWGDCI